MNDMDKILNTLKVTGIQSEYVSSFNCQHCDSYDC